MIFADLLTLENISLLTKKTDSSTFFEAVAEQTKLAGIKTQKLLYRVQRVKKKVLEEKLEQLRDNFHENSGASRERFRENM